MFNKQLYLYPSKETNSVYLFCKNSLLLLKINTMYIKSLLTIILLGLITFSFAQQPQLDKHKQYEVSGIGFYNLENLFDTIVDPDTNKILQEDFTPHGKKNFNSERYEKKIANMSYVISQVGTKYLPDGLAIIGVAEIENKAVLEDLVNHPNLKTRNYGIVHYDSPDARGIDVGLLYNPKYFKVLDSKRYPLTTYGDGETFRTRDQLLVTGELNGEKIHVIVAHWPSRRGGEKRSAPRRIAAGELGRKIIDSIQAVEPNAKIVYMGDLNDDPVDKSVRKAMKSVGSINKLTEDKLYNPMEKFYHNGIGTLAWRDSWNLFDQLILSPGFVTKDNNFDTYKFYKAVVFNREFLKNSTGAFKGYPHRTYVGPNFMNGYSDHFPVFMLVVKEKK